MKRNKIKLTPLSVLRGKTNEMVEELKSDSQVSQNMQSSKVTDPIVTDKISITCTNHMLKLLILEMINEPNSAYEFVKSDALVTCTQSSSMDS